MILGLDLSSVNSGYAIIKPCQESEITLIAYGSIIPSKKMNHSEKLEVIYNKVLSLIEEYKIEIVAIEDQHFRTNAKTMKLLSRISGIAMLAAQQRKCSISLYHATSVKKTFSGDGKASKEDMINTAVSKFNLNREEIDDNISDAIGVACTHYYFTTTL